MTNPDILAHRPAIIEEIRNLGRGIPAPKKPTTRLTPWQLKHPRPGDTGREPEFTIKPIGAWLKQAAKKPEAKMLFDRFWFQGELCILFADTNVGKSVLAVQIADSISKGLPIPGLQLTAKPSPVLYFDYELTDQQFHRRYHTAAHGTYPFSKIFSRAVTNPLANKMYKFSTHQQYIENEIENALLTAKAKVLIIDNITCLKFGAHAGAGAISLVQSLQMIKNKYDISIMVLAHTPKRNPTKPVTRNDLQGSKMLINFCDSAFAIGESQSENGLRYLKQIKQRSVHQQYGAENVCLCRIAKPQNYLHFQFVGHALETDHLAPYTEQYRKNTEQRIAQLNKKSLSVRQIAAELNIPSSTVFRTLKRLNRLNDEEMGAPEEA